ncbi:hypothetical protein LTR49_028466, partial [Elasticomyces elasticus]
MFWAIPKKSPSPTTFPPLKPAALPQVTANTSLGPPQTQTSPQPRQSFLDKALLALTPREREIIKAHQTARPQGVHAVVEDAYTAALSQKRKCEDKRWRWEFRGRTVVLRDEADKVAALLDRFKSVGDVVANVDPVHVGLPWAGIRIILEAHLGGCVRKSPDGRSSHRDEHGYVHGQSTTRRLPSTLATENFETALVKMYTQELRFLATAIETYQKSTATRIWQALWQPSTLEEFESVCDKLGSRAEIEASNCEREMSALRWEEAKQWKGNLEQALRKLDDIQSIGSAVMNLQITVDLTKLVTAKAAMYNSYVKGDSAQCLEGTRTQLLDQIGAWTEDPASKCIFWLCGMAGTGKSTISRTLSHTLNKDCRLRASFFFKRGERERSNAGHFFPTIARQLATILPAIKAPIAQALDVDPQLCERNLQEQFENLIRQPLLQVTQGHTSSGLIIVIDALDECERSADIRTVLRLLAQLESIVTFGLRVFVTSRPELPIQLGFRKMSGDLHQDI